MSRVRVDRYDKNRVLLTETLPYETPMLFSNDGFYSLVSANKFEYYREKIRFRAYKKSKNEGNFGLPFNYEISRSNGKKTRKLSVIHPVNQLAFIELYESYSALILHLTNKSTFSLRKPSGIAKYFYSSQLVFDEDTQKENDAEIDPEVLGKETKILKSYFTYKPIDLIYKFFERHEYRRLEQKFEHMLEFDISKCFYNIYTHSISWAVKGKENAKKNHKKKAFENMFDKIMQLANYNETNGIVVGPEVSRIFAEIILQDIDHSVFNSLKKMNYRYRIDFEIKRYVDDYFVFSNDTEILEITNKLYREKLEDYKLYINDSKTKTKSSPFLTNIGVGKRELKKLSNAFLNQFIIKEVLDNDGEETVHHKITDQIGSPYHKSNEFIKDFQAVAKGNDLTYEILSKDIVRNIKSQIVKTFKLKNLKYEKEDLEKYLLILLDISFYAYSLNINSTSTFKLSQTIVILCKFLKEQDQDLRQTIFSKIFNETNFVIDIFLSKAKSNITNVETLNLLIALTKLDEAYLFSENRLIEIFSLKSNTSLNYFQIVVLLYYIEEHSKYNDLKEMIKNEVIRKISSFDNPFEYSELTMLFFDLTNCPHLDQAFKRKLMRLTKYTSIETEIIEIQKIESHTSWFMDWEKEIDLERVLKKKEWSSSY